jgi:hypothetical protein
MADKTSPPSEGRIDSLGDDWIEGRPPPDRRGVAFRAAAQAQVDASNGCSFQVLIDATPRGPNAVQPAGVVIPLVFSTRIGSRLCTRASVRAPNIPSLIPRPQVSNAAPLRSGSRIPLPAATPLG